MYSKDKKKHFSIPKKKKVPIASSGNYLLVISLQNGVVISDQFWNKKTNLREIVA